MRKYASILVLLVYAGTFPPLEVTHFHLYDVDPSSSGKASIPDDKDASEGKVLNNCPICLRIHSSFPAFHVERQIAKFIRICSLPMETIPTKRDPSLQGFSQRAPPLLYS